MDSDEVKANGLARSSDSGPYGDLLFRLVSVAALALGTLSGVTTLSSTDDRYRAADASRDFQLRDAHLQYVEKRVEDLEKDVERIDTLGPQTPNEELLERVRRQEEAVQNIVEELRDLKRHQ